MTSLAELAGARVLVTGGLGFIGANVAHALVALGAEVTILDSLDPDCGGDRLNAAGIEERAHVVIGDVRDAQTVGPLVDASDLVINCAARTSHAGSMDHPLEDIDVNCKGTIVLLEAARRTRRARFVHLGTTTQIGRARSEPVTEDHPEFPMEIYSADKSAAEKYVLVYGRAYGLPVTVLRLANCYGPRARITDARLGFMNYFIGLALQDRDLPVYGSGEQRRLATFVDDVVEAILLASTRKESLGQVFFAASARSSTVRQIAETIVAVVGSGRVLSVAWPEGRATIEVGDAIVSSERIRGALGWSATTELAEGLRRTAEWFRPRLSGYLG